MQCPLPPVRICPPRGGARIVVPGTDPCTTAPLHSPLPRRVAIRFASPSRHQTRMRILYPILKPGTTKRAPPVGEMPIRAFCQLRPIRQLVRFLHPPQSILPFSKSLGGARVVVPGTDPCTTAPLHSPLPRRVATRFASPSRHQTRMRILYPILKPGTTKRAPPVGEMPIRAFCQLRPIRQLVRFLHPPQSILPFSKSLGGARVVVPETGPCTTGSLLSHSLHRDP